MRTINREEYDEFEMCHKIDTPRRISKTDNMWSQLNPSAAKIGCRHTQVFLLLLGFLCCYAIRVVLSISLVAMTTPDATNLSVEVYDWNDSLQNFILSSFLWGFVITQIPGGEVAQRFGAQKFFCFAIGICGVMTILIPAAARYGGWQAVIVIRILTGAVQGVVPPCAHILISKWVPVQERGRAGSCVYSGGMLGNVIALLSCGAISKSALGWPSSFYVWGGIAILWAILYHFIGKESPSAHPTISIYEEEYIERSLDVTDTIKTLKTPWISILTSTPFWALLIAQCADCWGSWMLLTKIPTYMANVLGYNIFENGVMTAIPYFVACLLSFPISLMCDKMVKNGRVSLKAMRKIANSVGLLIPAFGVIGFSYVNKEYRTLAVAILILSVGFNVSICSGYLMNHVDLSPNYSGTLMGITNAAANIFGIMAPLICGVIVPDVTNIYQWRQVFFLSAGVYISGNMIFVLLGDATVQPWNKSLTQEKIDDDASIMPNATLTSEKFDDKINGRNYKSANM